MKNRISWFLAAMGLLLGGQWSQQSTSVEKNLVTPETLRAEIEALQPAKHVWREVKWKTCLLEALRDARAQKKPVLLWVLGGEPTKGRC